MTFFAYICYTTVYSSSMPFHFGAKIYRPAKGRLVAGMTAVFRSGFQYSSFSNILCCNVRFTFLANFALFLLLWAMPYALSAQSDTLDLFSTRLFCRDATVKLGYVKDRNVLLCRYLPSFSASKLLLPNTFSSDLLGSYQQQVYRPFVYDKKDTGYVEYAATVVYQGQQYRLPNFIWLNNISLYQSLNVPGEPNCFYLVYWNHGDGIDQNHDYHMFLCADKICLEADGTVSDSKTTNIDRGYLVKYPTADGGNMCGFLLRGADGKDSYLHAIYSHDTTYEIYSFTGGRLNRLSSSPKNKLFIGDIDHDMTASANSRMICLAGLTSGFARYPRYEGDSGLYIYRTDNGYTLKPLDTFCAHTIDTTGLPENARISFSWPRYSPTGRFLYITEQLRTIYTLTKGPRTGNISNYFPEARLLQLDMASLMRGGKPKVSIIKRWKKYNHGYRIFLHTVSADGRLYYCVEDDSIHARPDDLPDTVVSLWRINNPDLEMDSTTFASNTQKVMDNLPYPITYLETETYNPATWVGYPYHAVVKSACTGIQTTLSLHSIVPFDSVVWQPAPGISRSMVWPDTSIRYAFGTQGNTNIVFHVWRKGYEDVIYNTINIPGPAVRHDELRTLPRTVHNCDGVAVVLQPGKDSLALRTAWADGYTGTSRSLSKSDTVVWQVWYDTTRCPRNDTVIIYISTLNKATLSGISACDSSNAYLHIDNVPKNVLIKWNDGDSLPVKKVSRQGTYTVSLQDTLSGCSKMLSASVQFIRTVPPAWNGKDTVLCSGDVLSLDIPQGYTVTPVSAGTTVSGSSILIASPGAYTFSYRPSGTGVGEIGCTHLANINVRQLAAEDSLCQKVNCELYIPNAFTPDNNGRNDSLIIMSNCSMKSFRLQVFNRWGEKVFETDDIRNHWNGTFRGAPCLEGIYLYLIAAKAASIFPCAKADLYPPSVMITVSSIRNTCFIQCLDVYSNPRLTKIRPH